MKTFFLSVLFAIFTPFCQAEVAKRGTVLFDGKVREHYLFIPDDAGPTTPLVIALHGMGGNAANLRFGIGLTEEMEAIGLPVVYPQGVRLPQGSRHWNAGFDFIEVNDIGYLSALANSIAQRHGLSQDVIFFGISMGGYMAYHMACQSDLSIKAIIVVAGTMPASDIENCDASLQISLLHIHGVQDRLIPFDGGAHWSSIDKEPTSIPQIVKEWAVRRGAVQALGIVAHQQVEELRFLRIEKNIEVQLLRLPNFGHDWPSEETIGYRAISDIREFVARATMSKLSIP